MISTSAQLLRSLQLDDYIYGFVGSMADEQEAEVQDNGVKLWNLPGLGVLGIGAATAALVAWYVANPGAKDTLDSVVDLFKDSDRDSRLDEVAEKIGVEGDKFDPNAEPPEDKPRIVDAAPIGLPSPKAEPKPVEAPTPTPSAVPPAPASVSRGYQVPGSALPAPSTLARPSVEINDILKNTAKTEGVDYRTLYALAGSESSFRAGANATKSSAAGLFQFTAPTWEYLTKKVYPDLGYSASDRMDPQKSSVLGSRYIKSIQGSLTKKLGRTPSLGETYLGYFMGPTGAHNFLDALKANPNQKGADVFAKAAEANPNLFYHKGDKTKPLTLQETMDRLEGKVTAYAEQAGITQVAAAVTETAPDIKGAGGAKPLPVVAQIPATSTPAPQQVTPPDFTAYKGGAKGDARGSGDPEQVSGSNNRQPTASTSVASAGPGSSEPVGEKTYVRDKQGRLIVIRS